MKQKHDKRSVHNRFVAHFQSHMPCGQCTNYVDSAVRRVFEPDEAVPSPCRYLWAVLSACVEKKGWDATLIELEALACRHLQADATAWVGNTVQNIMSNLSIAEAA